MAWRSEPADEPFFDRFRVFREQLGLTKPQELGPFVTLASSAIDRLRLALSDELFHSGAVVALRDELHLMAPPRIPKSNRALPWAKIQRDALRYVRRYYSRLSPETQEDVVGAAILDALVDARTARANDPTRWVCKLARSRAGAAGMGREPVPFVPDEDGDTLVNPVERLSADGVLRARFLLR
jgi:hypothetical protein